MLNTELCALFQHREVHSTEAWLRRLRLETYHTGDADRRNIAFLNFSSAMEATSSTSYLHGIKVQVTSSLPWRNAGKMLSLIRPHYSTQWLLETITRI